MLPHNAYPALACKLEANTAVPLPCLLPIISFLAQLRTNSPALCFVPKAILLVLGSPCCSSLGNPAVLQFGLPSASLVGGPLCPLVARDCTSSCFGASPNPQVWTKRSPDGHCQMILSSAPCQEQLRTIMFAVRHYKHFKLIFHSPGQLHFPSWLLTYRQVNPQEGILLLYAVLPNIAGVFCFYKPYILFEKLTRKT